MEIPAKPRWSRLSPWIAILLTAVIGAATILLTAALQPGAMAVAGEPLGGIGSMLGTYQGPQHCAECHPSEFYSWAGTTHAQASFDPVFQTYLQSVEQPGECFACHTTGYNAQTGQFVTAGVTCESCHGPYRDDHPGQSMEIATADELCGTCHRSTVAEWRTSNHGQAGIACVACHEVHSQKTHMQTHSDALCAGCHVRDAQDALHQAHLTANVGCISCHVARPEFDVGSAVSGMAETGHSFEAAPGVCVECHVDGP
ncbi:MAG: hypothetical protein H6649_00650 [Caldilineae bacterium]|nr:hypothetical protein [Anaerolineae bacterium]MCB0255382.1 hypothetical protein [Anaerolineae bacterium]MCB9143390.1 hypothetical protein [Anaerolineales bacterium]MCB9152552.1 hypothetical protein [Caldilineae bacterium]